MSTPDSNTPDPAANPFGTIRIVRTELADQLADLFAAAEKNLSDVKLVADATQEIASQLAKRIPAGGAVKVGVPGLRRRYFPVAMNSGPVLRTSRFGRTHKLQLNLDQCTKGDLNAKRTFLKKLPVITTKIGAAVARESNKNTPALADVARAEKTL